MDVRWREAACAWFVFSMAAQRYVQHRLLNTFALEQEGAIVSEFRQQFCPSTEKLAISYQHGNDLEGLKLLWKGKWTLWTPNHQ
jgi:hypothetical protein